MSIPQQPLDRPPDLVADTYALAALNATVRGDNLGADASPAGNDGTPAGGVVSLSVGARFEGTDDTIDFGDIGDIQQVSMWVNPVTTTEQLFLVDAGAYVHLVAGTVIYVGLATVATYVNGIVGTTLAAGEWQYLVCQFTQDDANNFELAVDGAGNFGAMDVKDLRAMDAVWSAARVAYEYQQGVPDDDLAFWVYDGTRDLTRFEHALTHWNGPVVGRDMTFDGADDSIQSPAIELTSGASVSLWFNADAVEDAVLFNDVPHDTRRLVIQLRDDNTIRAGYWTGAVYRSASGGAYAVGRWHHVYCTWDADETVRLWLDGEELVGTDDPSSGNGVNLRLGASSSGTGNFDGRMRDVRMWVADKGPDFGLTLRDRTRRAY